METIWTRTAEIPASLPLPHSIRTEIAVIGGGMAGILTAFLLQGEGREVVVLEQNRVGSGQTRGTTAKITLSHNLIYGRMLSELGEAKARQYVSANQRAVKSYRRLIGERGIDCGFRECRSFLYSVEDAEKMKREAEAAARLGIAAEFASETELPFGIAGAVCYRGQASFHPLAFLRGLSEELQIYERTQVLDVVSDAAGAGAEGTAGRKSQILTNRGTVTADIVVFASHYPIVNSPGYYFARMYQERSYVLALEKASVLEDMYLGVDEGEAFSFRSFGETLLFGGEGHRTGRNAPGGQYRRLKERAESYWPDCGTVAAWSVQDCMTLDGIPYIGRYTGGDRKWYVAAGFGKWGMSSSMAAAMILTDLICGRTNASADVFSPQRVPGLRPFGRLVAEGARSVRGLLAPEGPRCPHLGCRLNWNPEEETWDCPCHGSRFDRAGYLLDNPAIQGIPRLKMREDGR